MGQMRTTLKEMVSLVMLPVSQFGDVHCLFGNNHQTDVIDGKRRLSSAIMSIHRLPHRQDSANAKPFALKSLT
jgi:hypothetical protein